MISLLYTTARVYLAKQQIELWFSEADNKEDIEVILCLDKGAVIEELPTTTKLVFNNGKRNCVSGWNKCFRNSKGDILVQVSDDLIPPDGWDSKIKNRIIGGGALAISDGLSACLDFLPHSIVTRDVLIKQGYLFHDSYNSMWCDNEFTETMKLRGKVINALGIVFHHKNGEFKDDVAKKHNSHFNTGGENFQYRKNLGFKRHKYFQYDLVDENSDGMYSPRLGVSLPYFKCPKTVRFYLDSHVKSYNIRKENFGIECQVENFQVLIPTVESRKEHLNTLLLELERQGINYIVDSGGGSTGTKRNRLIQKSQAKYITFIDDDDWISHDYGEKINEAISNNNNMDVILYDVLCNIEQQDPRLAILEVNGVSGTNDKIYNRIANHLMVWKRELAVSVPFSDITFGEDTDWAIRINPKVKDWMRIHSILYFYENIKKSTPDSYVPNKRVETIRKDVNILKLSTRERQKLRLGQ